MSLINNSPVVHVVIRISSHRHLINSLLSGHWINGWTGHDVRRIGRTHRVSVNVVNRIADNRPDDDNILGVHRQNNVEYHGQSSANDENNIGC